MNGTDNPSTLSGWWDEYRSSVLQNEFSAELLEIMRKTFYAGAVATLAILERNNESKISESTVLERLDELQLEIDSFEASIPSPPYDPT